MNEGFAQLDDALIDRVFQPLADWVEHHTEFDVFRIARLCIDLAALAWIVSQAGNVAKTAASGNLALEAFQFGVIVLGLSAISVLRRLFERAGGTGRGRMGACANPLRAGMQVHRAACLCWLIGLLVKTGASPAALGTVALLALAVFATAAVYVGSCQNRPRTGRESRHLSWNARLAPVRR